MDLLGRNGKSWILAVAGLVIWLAGCSVWESVWPGDDGLAFSHEFHVDDQGLACEDCHESAAEADLPSIPTLDGCLLCHEGLDEEKDREDRIDTLFTVDGVYRARVTTRLPEDVLFSHPAHAAEYGLECSSCHADVIGSDRASVDHAVSMAECADCHVDRNVGSSQDCATCHAAIDRTWSPPSHEHGWTQLHGQVARAGETDVAANQCTLCHTETTCVACHQEIMPRDHNNYWRLRGHAVASSVDRSRCWTCHRTDYCERCHADMQPRSHQGGWGSPTNRHCVACHLPLSAVACYTCHKSAPSHDMAPPLPSGHDPAWNCRQCHGGSMPPPHPDSGDDCTICHH